MSKFMKIFDGGKKKEKEWKQRCIDAIDNYVNQQDGHSEEIHICRKIKTIFTDDKSGVALVVHLDPNAGDKTVDGQIL